MLYLPQDTPRVLFFVHTIIGGALSVILYFLVIWFGAIFSSTQTAAIFVFRISVSVYIIYF